MLSAVCQLISEQAVPLVDTADGRYAAPVLRPSTLQPTVMILPMIGSNTFHGTWPGFEQSPVMAPAASLLTCIHAQFHGPIFKLLIISGYITSDSAMLGS